MFAVLADLVLLMHLAFVLFVVLGGLWVLFRPRVAWLHVPAFGWGALVELAGLPCPLTPLEQWLRQQAGEMGYAGGFVEHYLVGALYPELLTRGDQILLGVGVLAVNGLWYGLAWRRQMRT